MLRHLTNARVICRLLTPLTDTRDIANTSNVFESVKMKKIK